MSIGWRDENGSGIKEMELNSINGFMERNFGRSWSLFSKKLLLNTLTMLLIFVLLILMQCMLAKAFKLKELDVETYLQWSKLTLEEKVPYLVDKFMLYDFQQEYSHFVELDVAGSNHKDLTFPILLHALSEFQTENQIRRYFDECDTNKDDIVDLQEYVVCRGYNSKNGYPSDVSEYDVLENVVLDSFKEKFIDNPKGRSPLYKYDENGIIID